MSATALAAVGACPAKLPRSRSKAAGRPYRYTFSPGPEQEIPPQKCKPSYVDLGRMGSNLPRAAPRTELEPTSSRTEERPLSSPSFSHLYRRVISVLLQASSSSVHEQWTPRAVALHLPTDDLRGVRAKRPVQLGARRRMCGGIYRPCLLLHVWAGENKSTLTWIISSRHFFFASH